MYLKHNSGKSVCISPGYFKLPNVPPVDQQIDFIKLSLSYGHQHVLVMDCIFSHWIESFPCRQVTATSVAVCVVSCLTLCNPMDCSPPVSSVHGIFQAIDMSLSKLREIVKYRETWNAAIHGVPES